MALRKEEVADNVWAIYSDTQEEIGKAFVRFQEYYENKDLKGKTDITVRDVEDWWTIESEEHETKSKYYEFWSGFNVPGKVIIKLLTSPTFRNGFSLFPWWYKEEDNLLTLLQDLTPEEIVSGYFIGLWKDSTQVLDHEIAHALYTTNPHYKAAQNHNISLLPIAVRDSVRQLILSMGYHQTVVDDELQAYFSTYADTVHETFDTHDFDEYTPEFEQTFEEATLLFRE